MTSENAPNSKIRLVFLYKRVYFIWLEKNWSAKL